MAIIKEAYIFYSHSDYSDVWPMMVGQTNKYLKNKKKYIISNKVDNLKLFKGWEIITYNDRKKYTERFASALEQVQEDVVIFHHEDMFLYSEPNFEEIDRVVNRVKSGEADIVKLCRASYNNIPDPKLDKFIHFVPLNLNFAIQPSVCSRKVLLNIYSNTPGDTIWTFEQNASNYVRQNGFNSFYYFNGKEKKRGRYHWDSSIYPYVATAIVKGKWDYEHYPQILEELTKKYGIDTSIRGKNV